MLSGDVQYVGFRSELEERLSRHRFSGFVYNDRKDGTVKLVCEGDAVEIKLLEDELNAEYPEVKISLEERVILPKPVGRVVVGLEQDIFERLDLGVSRLGSIDENLGSVGRTLGSVNTKLGKLDSMDGKLGSMDGKLDSMDTKLGKLNSMDGKLDTLKDIKKVLERIAEK